MPQPDLERRFFAADRLSIETRDAGRRVLRGHAAVFNQRSENFGGWFEVIAPGAFDEALQQDDVRALFNHNSDIVLGRTASKTLKLSVDERGLAVEIELPSTQTVADLVVAPIERGDVSQMSFGFRTKTGGSRWDEDADGMTIRTLTNLKLFEVSPVAFPAYPQTDVAVRSLDEWRAGRSPAHRKLLSEARRRLVDAL